MNSALLLALNAVALATLVMFQTQSPTEDAAQISQAIPRHLHQQQRPQLAVMNATAQSSANLLAKESQATPVSEHWVF